MNKEKYWLVHDKGFEITEHMLTISDLIVFSRFHANNLFDNKADAIARQSYLKDLYNSFKRTPYVTSNKIENNLTELLTIEYEITKQLATHSYFDGIDFCDVGAGGIQIRGHHKKVHGYVFSSQITIKYDFSNWEECIEKFVDEWKSSDTEQKVKEYKNFLDAGDLWGWD